MAVSYDDKIGLFRKIFGGISGLLSEDVRALADLSTEASFKKDEAFVCAGGDSDRFALVGAGIFRALYMNHDGKRVIRRFYRHGNLMGSFAMALARQPAHVTIEALESATAFVFKYSTFAALREQRPAWEKASRVLLETNYVQRETRAYQLLALNATERLRLFREEYADVCNRIPKGDVASYLGISPVSLSRILHPKGI